MGPKILPNQATGDSNQVSLQELQKSLKSQYLHLKGKVPHRPYCDEIIRFLADAALLRTEGLNNQQKGILDQYETEMEQFLTQCQACNCSDCKRPPH